PHSGMVRSLPFLGAVPVVDVLAHLVAGDAVALLDLALELLAVAGDDIEVVVGQAAPLFLHLALELLPVTFDAVPVHRRPLDWDGDWWGNATPPVDVPELPEIADVFGKIGTFGQALGCLRSAA